MKFSGRWVWITGASSGIGRAIAIESARLGANLVLLARSKAKLNELSKELQIIGAKDTEIVHMDLSRSESSVKELEVNWMQSKRAASILESTVALVNNAGLALGTEAFDKNSDESILQVINTNVIGLTLLTKRLVPTLKKNQGHIVNIGSVAGHWTYPGGAVYCASKAAVRALSEGFRLDLHGSGVRVTNIEPGMVDTGFSVVRFGNEEKARKLYEGMSPLTAEDIAETVIWCLSRPVHVNVQELMIFPTDQSAVGYVHRKETP